MVCRRHEATPPASGLAAVVVRGPAIGGGGAGRRAEEDCLAKSLLEVGGAGMRLPLVREGQWQASFSAVEGHGSPASGARRGCGHFFFFFSVLFLFLIFNKGGVGGRF